MAATHSIESSYFHSISTDLNKSSNQVRDHVLYPSQLIYYQSVADMALLNFVDF